MEGSGLEEMLKVVYGSDTVQSINQSINEVTDAGTEVPLYPYLKCKHNF